MLQTLADHLEIVWGALLAASIVVLLTPAVGGMARLLGVVDRPDGRRLNRRTVPRLGGIALFFGVFVPALAFLDLSSETRGLLLGAAVATTVGAVDDFRGLRWFEKLGGQVAAAATVGHRCQTPWARNGMNRVPSAAAASERHHAQIVRAARGSENPRRKKR